MIGESMGHYAASLLVIHARSQVTWRRLQHASGVCGVHFARIQNGRRLNEQR